MDGLVAKRAELTNQLQSLTERRGELTEQRERMGRDEGRNHEVRIRAIDERSARIEQDLLQTNEAIASALSSSVGGGQGGSQAGPASMTGVDPRVIRAIRNEVEDSIFGALAGGAAAFVAIYVVWRGIRRFIFKKKPAPPLPDQTGRLEQLQHSMDVIAIEVERISEAQRFVAKVLNEKLPALGTGGAQPVSMREREAVSLDAEKHRR